MSTRIRDYYGEGRLIGPREEVRATLANDARRALMAKFPKGRCSGRKETGEALRCYFDFLMLRLRSLLRKVGSGELMEFLLYQYDLAAIEWRGLPVHGSDESVAISSGLSGLRRGLKFVAECTTMMSAVPELAPAGAPNLYSYVEEVLLTGEQLAEQYMLADRIYYGLGGEPEIEFAGEPGDGEVPGLFRLVGVEAWAAGDLGFNARLAKDQNNQQKYFPDGPVTRDFKKQAAILDEPFEKSFGCPFTKFLQAIALANEQALPAQGGYPVVFYPKEVLIKEIAESGLGVSREALRIIFAGFTVTRQQMELEQRAIYNPKQEHRALRRGYFAFPRRGVPHLVWSRQMALEALDMLVMEVCFKKLPREWVTERTAAGLDQLSNVAGAWFERAVTAKLLGLGFRGEGRKGRVLCGGEKLEIPAEVGQLDFLGYSEKDSAIVVIECKMVNVGYEARFYRDELSQFLEGKKGYAVRFRRKIDWAAANRHQLARAFGAECESPRVLSAVVTLYPVYAASRIPDFPCVSLVEFLEDYGEKGAWPYMAGIR